MAASGSMVSGCSGCDQDVVVKGSDEAVMAVLCGHADMLLPLVAHVRLLQCSLGCRSARLLLCTVVQYGSSSALVPAAAAVWRSILWCELYPVAVSTSSSLRYASSLCRDIPWQQCATHSCTSLSARALPHGCRITCVLHRFASCLAACWYQTR
jgi:hypothetical protein